MIIKKKTKSINCIKVSKVCHAGSLPGRTSGGKTHVINLVYTVDKSLYPSDGISNIILSLCDARPGVKSITADISNPKEFTRQVQSLNASLREANTNLKTSGRGVRVGNYFSATDKNLNTTFCLIDPFANSANLGSQVKEFLARKEDENALPSSYSVKSSDIIAFGEKQAISLVKVGNKSQQRKESKIAPIRLDTRGVNASVSLSNNSKVNRFSPEIESINSSGGVLNPEDFNIAQAENEANIIEMSLEYFSQLSKIDTTSNETMGLLLESGLSALESDPFQTYRKNSSGKNTEVSTKDACFDMLIQEKIDPATAILVPPITDTGLSAALGISPSDSYVENLRSLSEKGLRQSRNQSIAKKSYNIITNPEIQTFNDLSKNDLVPVLSKQADSTAQVSQMIPINSSHANSYNRIYANISVYTKSGKVVQDHDFEINLRDILTESDIPILPPTLASYPLPGGIVSLTVSQNDKNATGVEVYAREASRIENYSTKNPWKKILETDLTDTQGEFIFDHIPETSCPIIYRAIPKTKSRKAACFGSTVAQATDEIGNEQKLLKYSSSVSCFIRSENEIIINISNIKGGPQYLRPVRKNCTLFDTDFSFINIQEHGKFVNTGEDIAFIDSTASEGYIYEYGVVSTSVDGIDRMHPSTAIIDYINPDKDVLLSVGGHTVVRGKNLLSPGITIPIETKFSSNQDILISRIITETGLSKDEIDQIPDLIDRTNSMTGVLVTRIDETSGEYAYLGFFPSGKSSIEGDSNFLDTGDPAMSVPSPQTGRKYRYIFEAVINDISQIIDFGKQRSVSSSKSRTPTSSELASEISTRKQIDKNNLTFTNDASSGIVSDPKNPNRPEKIFNKRTLGKGRDSGMIVNPKESLSQEIETGRTGVYSSTTVDLRDTAQPEIIKASCKIRSDGHVLLNWSVKNTKNIDHFLIQETRFGNSSVSISAHNQPDRGTYSIIDPTARSRPGSVSYSIIPVDIEFGPCRAFSAGTVVIYPENQEAQTVIAELPTSIAAKVEGPGMYPKI